MELAQQPANAEQHAASIVANDEDIGVPGYCGDFETITFWPVRFRWLREILFMTRSKVMELVTRADGDYRNIGLRPGSSRGPHDARTLLGFFNQHLNRLFLGR